MQTIETIALAFADNCRLAVLATMRELLSEGSTLASAVVERLRDAGINEVSEAKAAEIIRTFDISTLTTAPAVAVAPSDVFASLASGLGIVSTGDAGPAATPISSKGKTRRPRVRSQRPAGDAQASETIVLRDRQRHRIYRFGDAQAHYDAKTGQIRLLKGSRIASEWRGTTDSYGEALENLLTTPGLTRKAGDRMVLVMDVVLTSPACAASLVSGSNTRAAVWKDSKGRQPQEAPRIRALLENGYRAMPIAGGATFPVSFQSIPLASADAIATAAAIERSATRKRRNATNIVTPAPLQ